MTLSQVNVFEQVLELMYIFYVRQPFPSEFGLQMKWTRLLYYRNQVTLGIIKIRRHDNIAIISLTFQLNAYNIIDYIYFYQICPTCFGAYCTVLREFRMTCPKLSALIFFIMVDAQQARAINSYKNTTYKLLKTNAAIWYKKICKQNQIVLSKWYEFLPGDGAVRTETFRRVLVIVYVFNYITCI